MSSQTASLSDCSETCPLVAELGGRVQELEEENEELRENLAVKEERNRRLRKKLRQYENPHQPPSKKHGTTTSGSGGGKKGGESGDNGDEDNKRGGTSQEKLGSRGRGRKKGHEGSTREKPEPDRTEVVVENRCENCGKELGDPARVETRIVEDIPDPGSVKAVDTLSKNRKRKAESPTNA